MAYDSTAIRRELFKIRYLGGAFELYREADSFEALDMMLTCLHISSRHSAQGRGVAAGEGHQAGAKADFNLG